MFIDYLVAKHTLFSQRFSFAVLIRFPPTRVFISSKPPRIPNDPSAFPARLFPYRFPTSRVSPNAPLQPSLKAVKCFSYMYLPNPWKSSPPYGQITPTQTITWKLTYPGEVNEKRKNKTICVNKRDGFFFSSIETKSVLYLMVTLTRSPFFEIEIKRDRVFYLPITTLPPPNITLIMLKRIIVLSFLATTVLCGHLAHQDLPLYETLPNSKHTSRLNFQISTDNMMQQSAKQALLNWGPVMYSWLLW